MNGEWTPWEEQSTVEEVGEGFDEEQRATLAELLREALDLFDRLERIRSRARGIGRALSGGGSSHLRGATRCQRLHADGQSLLREIRERRAELGVGLGRSRVWAALEQLCQTVLDAAVASEEVMTNEARSLREGEPLPVGEHWKELNAVTDAVLEAGKRRHELFSYLWQSGEVLVALEPSWSLALSGAVVTLGWGWWLTRWLHILEGAPLLRDGLVSGVALLALVVVLAATGRWTVKE